MARILSVVVFSVAAAGAGYGQAPAFEAASVKPNTTLSTSSSTNGSKGQIVFTNQSLKRLVERAYEVKPFQVTGPSWLEDVRFDIAAKIPPDSKVEQRWLMLRTLLEDRFKLTVHRESKEMPGYALVVAKNGFKLKAVEPGGGGTNSNGGRVTTLKATKTSMAFLADYLARGLGVMVVDKTGIEGVYDFEMRFTFDEQAVNNGDVEPAPTVFTAVQETIGVRLQSQKVPVEVIVVDHAERVPVEN